VVPLQGVQGLCCQEAPNPHEMRNEVTTSKVYEHNQRKEGKSL
jgi:hypothetical protein